jgi:hypothetical protein
MCHLRSWERDCYFEGSKFQLFEERNLELPKMELKIVLKQERDMKTKQSTLYFGIALFFK